ncbi:methyltransferase [Halalkalibacter wakoensis JCM 9140]|uniref:Methyltransferase n=1 Tax=Halalkalibacter wakoensis JCM 9140 TaxID=1236970 RepID=W4Q4S2_9BACI|nr:class I SAM-dependent methyltransferase [Halalkalibacter wakoensis]GAE27086.1 methyltransferase [Halalkalibacter wakoensis JCM 9140]
MNYHAFAALYDALMEEAPYDKWVDYVYQNVSDLNGLSVLDVGCGTGELLVRLKNAGADVTGVDLSAEMLTVAKEKCEQAGFSPLLLQQSMTELDHIGLFDVVTIFCDSLNYLETEEEVQQTLRSVMDQMKDDAVLLFDVHSLSKIEKGFIGQTFAEDTEEMAYIWTSFEGEFPNSVEHELTFFVKNQHGYYERFTELHKQRTFPVRMYKEWLTAAGFQDLAVHTDFSLEEPTKESERIFFRAIKRI